MISSEKTAFISGVICEGNYEYHTFMLPEEKTLRAMLLGITQNLSTDKVKLNLKDVKFEVISLKAPQNKKIFNLTKLGHMLIKLEPQKTRTTIPQYHFYRKFGHMQDN